MKPFLISALLLLVSLSSSHADKRIVVFGDSLSKEYQVEFSNLDARNWIEILDSERHDDFDLGSFRAFPDFRLTGHKYNWSVPGFTSDDMLDNLTDNGFFQEIAQDEIKDHLRKEVDRVVIFLGGNDLRDKYSRLYANDEPDQIIRVIFNNLQSILNWVQSRNSNLEIVLANVPHIGATPSVKEDFGTNPENVAHVTAAVEDLNAQLALLAHEKGVGYADIYRITKDLLDGKPFCISGVPFLDESNDNAGKFYLWLGGIGTDFHPNTNGQAHVANAIIKAFNDRYDANILPLGGTEILTQLLRIEADRSFEDWIPCYQADSLSGPNDDPDHDGYTNFVEFVLDTHPMQSDHPHLTCPAPYQIDFRTRLRTSTHFTASFETSTDLQTWTPAPATELSQQPHGATRWTAATPVTAPQLFTRLLLTKPE